MKCHRLNMRATLGTENKANVQLPRVTERQLIMLWIWVYTPSMLGTTRKANLFLHIDIIYLYSKMLSHVIDI